MKTYRITYTDMNERVGSLDVQAYSSREALKNFDKIMNDELGLDGDSWILGSIRAL